MAQVIYKPPNNSFQLRVTQSKFICTNQEYERDVIMVNQVSQARGRAGLFRLGESENVEVLPILQKEIAFRGLLPDGYLDTSLFKLVFSNNDYSGCN